MDLKHTNASSQVFHLRQKNHETVFDIQNVNIKTSGILMARLETLRLALARDVVSVVDQTLAKVTVQKDDFNGDATSGIEYFYMAMTLLATDERVTPNFVQLVQLACKRDPASRLLQEMQLLVTKVNVTTHTGPSIAQVCSDVVRPVNNLSRASGCWNDSPKRGSSGRTEDSKTNQIEPEDEDDEDEEEDEDEEDEDEEDGSEDNEETLMVRRKTLRRVHDRLRLGLFLTATQLQQIDDALYANICYGTKRDEEKEHLNEAMQQRSFEQTTKAQSSAQRERSVLLLGPTLPRSITMHAKRCSDAVIRQIHIVDWSQRRLQTILRNLLDERKKLGKRIFISDSTSPKYCMEEPSWAGDRRYDYTTCIFSLHHMSAQGRRGIFQFVRKSSKMLHVVFFNEEEEREGKGGQGGQGGQADNDDAVQEAKEHHQQETWNHPATFTALVDSFEQGMREAGNAFVDDITMESEEGNSNTSNTSNTSNHNQSGNKGGLTNEAKLAKLARCARDLLAQHFVLALTNTATTSTTTTSLRSTTTTAQDSSGETSGETNNSTNNSVPRPKKRGILQALKRSTIVEEMEQQGLTVLSSTTLFDHWFRPVCSIVAKAKGNGSTATTVEELENENELLRLKVQELSDALLQSKQNNTAWTTHDGSNGTANSSAFKTHSVGR